MAYSLATGTPIDALWIVFIEETYYAPGYTEKGFKSIRAGDAPAQVVSKAGEPLSKIASGEEGWVYRVSDDITLTLYVPFESPHGENTDLEPKGRVSSFDIKGADESALLDLSATADEIAESQGDTRLRAFADLLRQHPDYERAAESPLPPRRHYVVIIEEYAPPRWRLQGWPDYQGDPGMPAEAILEDLGEPDARDLSRAFLLWEYTEARSTRPHYYRCVHFDAATVTVSSTSKGMVY
jgi:hypothetical protein